MSYLKLDYFDTCQKKTLLHNKISKAFNSQNILLFISSTEAQHNKVVNTNNNIN